MPYLIYMTAGANKFLRICYGRVKEYLAIGEKPPALVFDEHICPLLYLLPYAITVVKVLFSCLFYLPIFLCSFCKFPLDFVFTD